jgi:hypothetical protein
VGKLGGPGPNPEAARQTLELLGQDEVVLLGDLNLPLADGLAHEGFHLQ